jgi:chemotaxis protein histidine kinase CheA
MYTVIRLFVDLGIFISFIWWKFLKYLFMGTIFPVVLIDRYIKEKNKNIKPKREKNIKIKKENVSATVSDNVLKVNPFLKQKEKEAQEKEERELKKLREQDQKDAIIHEKKMAELKQKEEIKLAREKIKLDKIEQKKKAEALLKEKAEAAYQLKEQQRLINQEKKQKEFEIALEKKKQAEALIKEKQEKANEIKNSLKNKKEEAKAAKLKIKEEKIKRKKELAEEKRKLKEKNTYVNEKVVIEKKNLGDRINEGLEALIKIPKNIREKAKKKFSNSAFVRNKRNVEDMHREALLIDFTGDDAKKSNKKLVYEYVGKNAEGKLVKSYFEAFSKVEVHSFLLSEGFEVYSIKTSPLIQFLHGAKEARNVKFKNKDLIFFLTQLSTYIKAGIPLVESLRILSRQFSQKGYQKVFRSMIYELTMGDNFSAALEKQGNAFPKILVNMVKTSEMTGELPETLDDMQIYFEEAEKTKKQMITALTYPTIVFVLAIGAITFIMVYIVPQFAGIYADMDNAKLPGITVAIMQVSDFLKNYWNYASKFEEAKKQYEQIVAAINDNAKLMEKRVKEIVIDPFKIEGEFTISETEPHYITKPVPQVAPEQA